MRETGPASITPSGVPADRRDAAALTPETRSPATRRAYRAALARLEDTLAGRALSDATPAEPVATLTALTAAGLAPAGIARPSPPPSRAQSQGTSRPREDTHRISYAHRPCFLSGGRRRAAAKFAPQNSSHKLSHPRTSPEEGHRSPPEMAA